MNRQRIGFPLIVGLTVEHAAPVSAAVTIVITDVFRRLRERSPFGVLIIPLDDGGCAEGVRQAGHRTGDSELGVIIQTHLISKSLPGIARTFI